MMDPQPIIDAARQGISATQIERTERFAHYFVVDPTNGNRIERIDLEAGAIAPVRKRGLVQVFDAPSFNAVLAEHASEGANFAIYIDREPAQPRVIAVLNGHDGAGPGWGDHRVEIVFRFTSQWRKWTAIDGKMLGQIEFAEFIEDNLADIAAPAGAEMLEIAQYLSVTRGVDFKSSVRLSNGQVQFQNIENMDAKVGAGQIAIPETITLGIAPVMGLPPFRVEARFRYRLVAGKLTLGVRLQRVEDVMAAVVNDMTMGTIGAEGRPAVAGIVAPAGTVTVEGIAPPPTS